MVLSNPNIKGIKKQISMRAMNGLAEMILRTLEEMHLYYFENEISPQRRKWEELANSTIERKGHDTILVETGALKDSLTVKGSKGSIRTIRISNKQITIGFGSNIEYLVYHLEGTKKMPARICLGVSDTGKRLLVERIKQHIKERFK